MSSKSPKIAALVAAQRGHRADPHYLGFFDCFNRQLYFEAHEVLEALWLTDRNGPNGDFHKGLIQLAGAFVHIQKNRPRPACALFRLAEGNLGRFPAHHEYLNVARVLELARTWRTQIESAGQAPSLTAENAPRITPSEAAFAQA